MIDHSRKLIFIHIARTGGTSVETALVGMDWWQIEPLTKHISSSQARKQYGEEVWATYKKFTIVRNPWDRLVSMWATKWWHESSEIDVDCSFNWFINNIKPHPNEIYDSLLYSEILNEEIDYILRFENLQNDFDNLLCSIGVETIPLPHTEKRNHRHYTEFYSQQEKELVEEMFDKDISLFGYIF